MLGAGPTGLAAALGLSRDTLLVERETASRWPVPVDRQQAGYTFDHAGRVMFSQDPYVLALYERVLGANVHWHYRESSVFSDGAYLRQPDTAVTAELTAAYNRKLWTVPLDEIEPRALHNLELGEKGAGDPRAPQARARFGYPLRGGFQALMDGFLPLLTGQLRTGTVSCGYRRPGAQGDAGERRVHRLPEPRRHGAVAPSRANARGVRTFRRARSRKFAAVTFDALREYRRAAGGIAGKHWLYYPADTVFHRIFMQSNASPSSTPAGCSSFTCEITYSPERPLPCVGDDLVEQVLADCRRVDLLRHDDVIDVAFEVDIPLAYVIDDQNRARSVERIRNWLSTLDIHVAGR